MDGAAILVPRRVADDHREALWSHVRAHLEAGGWQVIEGHHNEGPFNRSAAINAAAAQTDADVLVIGDADTLVEHHQITSAVKIAAATGTVTFGFHRYAALDEPGTLRVLEGYHGSWEPFVAYEFINTASSCVVVRRDLWERVGGFDERFVGWGWEDVAFSLAAQSLGGGMHRVAGTAWHLWHEPSPDAGNDRSPIWRANAALCEPYLEAKDDPAAMAELLASR